MLAAYPGLDVRAREADHHPSAAVLNASREQALLLLGRSPRASPLGVGETVHDVLMNLNAPTVIVR